MSLTNVLQVYLRKTLNFLSICLTWCVSVFCLSLRNAVEQAIDPALAGITAYVSQDCTGIKTGSEHNRPNWPFFPTTFLLLGNSWATSKVESGFECSPNNFSITTISEGPYYPLLNPSMLVLTHVRLLSRQCVTYLEQEWLHAKRVALERRLQQIQLLCHRQLQFA